MSGADLAIVPLTTARFADLARLFNEGGDPKWGWCMYTGSRSSLPGGRPASAFHGAQSTFERAGFKVVDVRRWNQSSPPRPIMRLELS